MDNVNEMIRWWNFGRYERECAEFDAAHGIAFVAYAEQAERDHRAYRERQRQQWSGTADRFRTAFAADP